MWEYHSERSPQGLCFGRGALQTLIVPATTTVESEHFTFDGWFSLLSTSRSGNLVAFYGDIDGKRPIAILKVVVRDANSWIIWEDARWSCRMSMQAPWPNDEEWHHIGLMVDYANKSELSLNLDGRRVAVSDRLRLDFQGLRRIDLGGVSDFRCDGLRILPRGLGFQDLTKSRLLSGGARFLLDGHLPSSVANGARFVVGGSQVTLVSTETPAALCTEQWESPGGIEVHIDSGSRTRRVALAFVDQQAAIESELRIQLVDGQGRKLMENQRVGGLITGNGVTTFVRGPVLFMIRPGHQTRRAVLSRIWID